MDGCVVHGDELCDCVDELTSFEALEVKRILTIVQKVRISRKASREELTTDAFRRHEAKLRLGTMQPQVHRGLEEISMMPTAGNATGANVKALLRGSANCSQAILVTKLAQSPAIAAVHFVLEIKLVKLTKSAACRA